MKQVLLPTAVVMLLFANVFTAKGDGDTLKLSIQEAQSFALQHSLTIKNANFDLESAKKRVWESTAIGFPQISSAYSFTYNPAKLPTISFGSDSTSISIGTKSSSSITGTVSQLIFSGSYIVGLQAAKTYKEMVNQALENTQIDVRLAVTQSYYLILLTHETALVLKKNRENLENTLNDTRKMFEKGFVEETSVDQVSLALNQLDLMIASTERQESVARRLLNFQMGVAIDAKVQLADRLEGIVLDINRERVLETSFVLDKNIGYQIALTQIKVKKLLYRLQVSNYLPTISSFYQYQKYLNNQTFNFQPQNLLGLSVSLPIFSSGQRAVQVAQARIAYYKAQNDAESTQRGLSMQYLQLRDDFSTAWDKYLNSKQSLKLAQKIFDEINIKYKNGMASSMDLSQANSNLQESVASFYSVEYELLNAKLQLDKVTSNF